MSTPTDIDRRAKQVTKRNEREAKRRYELLAGQVRSQLRRQLDDILRMNTRAFILLLANGGALKVGVEAAEKAPEPVIDEPTGGTVDVAFPPPIEYDPKRDRFEDEPGFVPPKPLLEIVPQ